MWRAAAQRSAAQHTAPQDTAQHSTAQHSSSARGAPSAQAIFLPLTRPSLIPRGAQSSKLRASSLELRASRFGRDVSDVCSPTHAANRGGWWCSWSWWWWSWWWSWLCTAREQLVVECLSLSCSCCSSALTVSGTLDASLVRPALNFTSSTRQHYAVPRSAAVPTPRGRDRRRDGQATILTGVVRSGTGRCLARLLRAPSGPPVGHCRPRHP